VTACSRVARLLSLRTTGDLDADESARLEAHLAGCAGCRDELAAVSAVLELAKLPPPSDAERRVTATLAHDTVIRLRRQEGRATAWKRAAVGLMAAVAVTLAVLTPAMLGRRGVSPPAGVADGAATTATSSWEPDLDTVWGDTAILDDDVATAGADASDAAVASLDL
jgi:predicted anti-sigma-YlaC factor YlaD